MKFSSASLIYGVLSIVEAASSSAPIYVFDNDVFDNQSPQSSNRPSPVTPESTRLILSKRLGLSQHHCLQNVDQATLQQVNDFGGRPQHLLNDEGPDPAKLVIMVEGVEDVQDIFPMGSISPSLEITSPPTSSANKQLMKDLISQSTHKFSNGGYCSVEIGSQSKYFHGGLNGVRPSNGACAIDNDFFKSFTLSRTMESLEDFAKILKFGLFEYTGLDSISVLHITALEIIAKEKGVLSGAYKEAVNMLAEAFSTLATDAANGMQESTVILMPLSTRNAKRSSNEYGVYKLPTRSVLPPQQKPEAFLSESPIPEASSLSTSDFHPSQPQTLKASVIAEGIIPVCHASLNSCMAATSNCTGRGECYKKYGADKGASGSSECYSCRCSKTIRTNPDGSIKTTEWGGAACQKKDVSMPFFLLAGFTITMVAVLSWGIGMLYSMGSEDLPSVIGAGVSGPRAK
ncbi:MAG: hypothetical protein M1827_005496 [Pycnora praestabilis]|nr:MAG: hypothetical protein M1827_005496 [Pycnora praestabilis]